MQVKAVKARPTSEKEARRFFGPGPSSTDKGWFFSPGNGTFTYVNIYIISVYIYIYVYGHVFFVRYMAMHIDDISGDLCSDYG